MSRDTQGDNDLEDSQLNKKAQECVEYILFCCLAERKSIVRRADLNKNIIKEYSRSFKSILKLVHQYLNDVFGMELIDLDNEKGERFGIRSKFEYDTELNKLTQNETKKGLSAFMTDSTNIEFDREFQDQLKYSVLMIALSLIFMNENEIDSGLFWDSLKRLDINKEEKKHKYLGDVFKYFTSDLVRDGYLEYEQVKGIDPPSFKFKWGYRAKLEITKKSILNFVCEVYGGLDNCKPEEWIAQYNDAMKLDEFNKENEEQEETIDDTINSRPSRTMNFTQNETMATQSTSRATNSRRVMNNFDDIFDSQGTQTTQSTQRLRRHY